MIKGNKGEWSELYTLLKVISDGVLYAGNDELEIVEGVSYPVIKAIRQEGDTQFAFRYSTDHQTILISRYNSNGTKAQDQIDIPRKCFITYSELLYEEIKKGKSSFEIPKVEEFISQYNSSSIKASSTAKTDLSVKIHDPHTGQQPLLGFSIKSKLGSPSTLLNAGATTNFRYKITGINCECCSISELNTVPDKGKVRTRIANILNAGGKIVFDRLENTTFSNNLITIDSRMPNILSAIVLNYYSKELSKLSDLVELTRCENLVEFDLSESHDYYGYKIKRFLVDVALGMMPSKVWNGERDSTGGFLVVKKDGAILYYHLYNQNEFENYLLNHTKLDTASTSRHKFGEIYRCNDEMYIKLNLQIRFI